MLLNFTKVMMARIFSDNASTNNTLSIRECLDAVGYVKEASTQDAFKDLYQYMQFMDDWVANTDDKQEQYFLDTKVVVDDKTTTHQYKFAIGED